MKTKKREINNQNNRIGNSKTKHAPEYNYNAKQAGEVDRASFTEVDSPQADSVALTPKITNKTHEEGKAQA